jgi:DivIVA domain-containing protein
VRHSFAACDGRRRTWEHRVVTLLLTLLILAVVGLVAAVAAGRIAGGLDEPSSSLPGRGLPAGRVGVPDLERVRFSPALRGYRMDEVDDVLDRLTEELQVRDEELAELRRTVGGRLLHDGREPRETSLWGRQPMPEPEPDDEAAFLPPTGTQNDRGGSR